MKTTRLQLAVFILVLYALTLLTVTAGFFMDSNLVIRNSFGFAVAVTILLFTIGHGWDKRNVTRSLRINGLALGLILLSVTISGFIFDISYDGQSYHSQAIRQLDSGWNPFKEKLSSEIPNTIFIQHYAKGYSYVASAIYMQLGLFEGAKALNMLLMLASYFIVIELLELYVSSVKASKRQVIALLLACNPLTIFEIFTFYVDGQLSSCCLILFSSFFLFKNNWRLALVITASAIVILINLKFTARFLSMIAPRDF